MDIPMSHIEALTKNKQEHIDYIIAVHDYLGIESTGLREALEEARISEVYNFSLEAEKLYKVAYENELLDKILFEVKRDGVEVVKERYGLKG